MKATRYNREWHQLYENKIVTNYKIQKQNWHNVAGEIYYVQEIYLCHCCRVKCLLKSHRKFPH